VLGRRSTLAVRTAGRLIIWCDLMWWRFVWWWSATASCSRRVLQYNAVHI